MTLFRSYAYIEVLLYVVHSHRVLSLAPDYISIFLTILVARLSHVTHPHTIDPLSDINSPFVYRRRDRGATSQFMTVIDCYVADIGGSEVKESIKGID